MPVAAPRRSIPHVPALKIRQQRVVVAGVRVLTASAGAGRDVLLLPSAFVRIRSYHPAITELAARGMRVVAAEMPGSGGSPRMNPSWDFEDYGRWVLRLIERLELRRPIVIGHSHSGAAAFVAAANDPERFAGLVLCSPVGFDTSATLLGLGAGRGMDALVEPIFSMTAGLDIAWNFLAHTGNFCRQLLHCARADLRPLAPRMTVPTLLGWGAHDHTVPLQCAESIARLLPAVTSIYVCKTGSHDWLVTHAPEFANAVLTFTQTTARS